MAQEVLTTLKEHPDAWTRVDTILEYSQNQQTKYYALQILENVIKTRWKVLPRPQCEGNLVLWLASLVRPVWCIPYNGSVSTISLMVYIVHYCVLD